MGPDDLVTIIRRVVGGEYLINDKVFSKPAVASRVLKEFRELAVYGQDAAPITRATVTVEILDNIAQGMTNKQVAYALSISEQTVKNHMSSILRKLSVNDRTQAVVYAMRQGYHPDARGLIRDATTDHDHPAHATHGTMTDAALPATKPQSLPELSAHMANEVLQLDIELAEVDLLIAQAKTEAGRHEGRRVAASEKLVSATTAATSAGTTLEPTVAADLNAQLVLLTQRAALMESQVDVLEGKRRALAQFRDAVGVYNATLSAYGDVPPPSRSTKTAPPKLADPSGVPPAVSRLLLGAQEDLRREIARAMHDGPAQSLTNIVLQAQIVERLVEKDPSKAGNEVRQLVAMVQQTLEATKSFIFDVRPMVLDDLGLVPTLRRAARERGRRAGVAVDFEFTGTGAAPADGPRERPVPDPRRGTVGLSLGPRRAGLDQARLVRPGRGAGVRIAGCGRDAAGPDAGSRIGCRPAAGPRRDDGEKVTEADAGEIEAARREAVVALPPSTWREIQSRGATLGIAAELSPNGAELRLVADLPPLAEPAPTLRSPGPARG